MPLSSQRKKRLLSHTQACGFSPQIYNKQNSILLGKAGESNSDCNDRGVPYLT